MSKTLCKCGEAIVDIESPCPNSFALIPDEKMWPLIQSLATIRDDDHPTDLAAAAIHTASTLTYECPRCRRLLVFWDGAAAHTSYVRESPDENSN